MSQVLNTRAVRNISRETHYLRVRRNGRLAARDMLNNRTNANRYAIAASVAGL
jgi:hypothetical protein